MSEYTGKINVTKDTMLFVVNTIFKKNINKKTTKENILKIIPKIYTQENLTELIKMLPYQGYETLEKLLTFLKVITT